MDTMDGIQDPVLDLASLHLATETLEPYVLSWALGDGLDGEAECNVLALMKREEGVLLVMPDAFLPSSVVDLGNSGAEHVVFGPSLRCEVPAVIVDGGLVSETGTAVKVLVVDCLPEIVHSLRRAVFGEDIVCAFDADSPYALPSVDVLYPQVKAWLSRMPDLGAFYTPEEMEVEDVDSPQRTRQRPRAPTRRVTPTGGGAKPKRATTASLANELQSLVETLPRFSEQISQLAERQALMESRLAPLPEAALASARAPSAALGQVSKAPSLGSLAKSLGAPPRTTAPQSLGMLAGLQEHKPAELAALEEEKPEAAGLLPQSADSMLARAMLEQSRALNSLVAQIAQGQSDPMAELTGSSTAGTRGAVGRAKLQSELAAHKGSFFTSVMHSMARRMAPTSSVDHPPAALLERGISGLRYLERFGGYNRQRELGQLQFQVMTAFDFLMADNIPAAKDTVALLAVSIEQSNLDNGRMDLATLLCLQEDPPAAIFQNRQLSSTSRARSFAPLADQRWVTCALAFLKEMEVISAKRAELSAGPKSASEPSSEAAPKAKAKPFPKRKGRGKGAQPAEENEAQQNL